MLTIAINQEGKKGREYTGRRGWMGEDAGEKVASWRAQREQF